ncbi:MAG: TRAP transporter TatT component family protein [Alphaproteobacteria bacterium]
MSPCPPTRSSPTSPARALRHRAHRLYLRGRDYALRALELDSPGFRARLERAPEIALAALRVEQTGALYWATVAWAAAIASDKRNMDLIADLPLIAPMIRAVEDAIHHSSLTMIRTLSVDPKSMHVDVTIGVQKPDQVDAARVGQALPHGTVTVDVVKGGLDVVDEAVGDIAVIASAAIAVKLDFA